MKHILQKIDSLSIELFGAVDLNKINFVSNNDDLRTAIDQMPGSTHYRLMCLLSTLFNNETIYELGTHAGGGTLCLAYNKTNYVISYDYEYNVQVKKQSNTEFRIGDYQKDKALLSSPFIFIDINPNDLLYRRIYQYLIDNRYRGFTVWNNIHYNQEMQNFWDEVVFEKRDITNYGSQAGTGVIIF